MERAIVHLRNSKLPDAYDPPQVEAYRALADAKKAVDDALKKANQQLEDQTEDSIKQAYVKLLEEQKKIGADITRIDQTPKDANGDLPRQDAVRLGQLPGDQGKLQETASGIGQKLESLGSIVYVWTNRDIVRSMNQIKDDLGKPQTGVPTQAEERRVEKQLQAMIDNLAQKHKEREFASRQGGGGGGGGNKPPQMPGEAELRLLKALQGGVQESTATIDAQKDKDKEKLAALGGRQGELRGVFGQLLEKAAHLKLAPEPDNKDQLPEEASKEDVEDQEFDKQLRSDDLSADTVEKTVKLTGDRMARSRQRLAINDDPGARSPRRFKSEFQWTSTSSFNSPRSSSPAPSRPREAASPATRWVTPRRVRDSSRSPRAPAKHPNRRRPRPPADNRPAATAPLRTSISARKSSRP